MVDDAELLRRYVESRSEADFTALVERHFNVVYQAALRRMGGRSDLAQDVAQHVFTTLAREATQLVSHPTLVGWLFTATRYAASSLLRAERRRRERETDALMSDTLERSGREADWSEIRGQLDDAMDKLPELDRTAILLRFFHQQAYAEIGRNFGLSEEAARKRILRALDRLRAMLAKRGITSTAAALGVMLANQASTAAPVGLAQTIATTSLLPGATAALPASGVVATLMNTKLTLTIAGTLGLAGLLSLPPLGLAVYQTREATRLEATAANTRHEFDDRMAGLSVLRKQARDVAGKVSHLNSELDRTRAAGTASSQSAPSPPTTSPPASPTDAEALRNGKEFLASFPEVSPLMLDLSRAQIHANLDGFYRTASLTPAQIDELESRTAQLWLEALAVYPGGTKPLETELPADQLRQILGEENFLKFQEFNRGRTAHRVARETAVMVSAVAPPMSVAQTHALEQAMRDNSGEYQNGGSLSMRGVDWAQVIARTETFLSPEQWRVALSPLLGALVENATEAAQREAAAADKPKEGL